MKKKLIILSVLIFALSCFTGCGKTMELSELSGEQIAIFEEVSNVSPKEFLEVKFGTYTVDELCIQQNGELKSYVKEKTLPKNAEKLLMQWKDETNWYALFENIEEKTSLVIPYENILLPIAIENLTPHELSLLKQYSEIIVEDFADVKDGIITFEELEASHVDGIDMLILSGDVPENAQYLVKELKEKNGYYELFKNVDKKIVVNGEIIDKPEPVVSVVQQTNKPKPSEKQEQTQKQEVTSKPIKPSNNTPKEEVVGTPGDVVSAGGGKSTVTDSENVVGGGFEASLAEDIAITEGISFEEALQRVKNGQY